MNRDIINTAKSMLYSKKVMDRMSYRDSMKAMGANYVLNEIIKIYSNKIKKQ